MLWLCAALPANAAMGPHETTIAAAGDIVCDPGSSPSATTCQDAATAALVTAAQADRLLAMGDLQYDNGALAAFTSQYDPVWGAFRAATLPVPGNHEYNTAGAGGYFDYWGAQASDRAQGWYATRIGSWLILSLNSNCGSIGGCGRSSAQGHWLESELAASTAPCQLAYWHHPRFSSGLHGNTADVQPLWEILQEHQAELVLAGHDHEFERFEPMLADGTPSSAGIASYVIGTGGVDLRDFATVRAGSAERIKKFGIGIIDLYANGWTAEFRATDGTTSGDGATHECAANAAAVAAPAGTPPTDVPNAASPVNSASTATLRTGVPKVIGNAVVVAFTASRAGAAIATGTIAGSRRGVRAATVVCRGTAKVKRAGKVKLTCTLNAAGRRLRKKGALKVTLTTAFTPKGGARLVSTQMLTVPKT